jgi:hypothetical protein
MTATMNIMTGPGEGEVTIRMACLHGTDELRFPTSVDDADTIGAQARVLAAQHWASFGCTCEIGVLINGEDEIQ